MKERSPGGGSTGTCAEGAVWASEAVWLKLMWLAVEVHTGRAVPDAPFPQALREAAAHRLPGTALAAGVGHVFIYRFPATDGEARTPPARRILATYTCRAELQGQGSGAAFRVLYTDGTGRIQWIRLRRDRATRHWIPAATDFVAYPDEP